MINSIIADVKARQTVTDANDGGKPGAVIYIPPGDYRLRTQVLIDISFLRIQGSGHGFTSSSIRFNVPEEEWPGLHELWPGGSRILVDIPLGEAEDESKGAAFYVERSGSPRISSVEFSNFCIDGLHFTADGPGMQPGEHLRQRQDRHLCRERQRLLPGHRHGVRLPRARSHDLQRGRAFHPRQLHRRMRKLHRAARVGSGIEDHRQLDRSRLQGSLDLRREPRRAPDHREQRLPPRREQRPPRRRHAFERHQQPPALVLPGDG